MTDDDTAATPPEATLPDEQQPESPRAARARHARLRRRLSRRSLLIIAIVSGATIAIGGLILATLDSRRDQQQEIAKEATAEAEVTKANARAIAEQIIVACERGDDIAELLGEVCQQAEQVAEEPAQPVAIPPSDDQVNAAVQRYCGEVGCARGPTAADVAAAVERYCDARGECRGDPGEDGEDGEDAPPLSDEQLAAAVANYCGARNECRGADGADGQNGTNGIDGRDGVDGKDGEPMYSFTWPQCDVLGNCTQYVCERDTPFDPERPSYSCRPTEG